MSLHPSSYLSSSLILLNDREKKTNTKKSRKQTQAHQREELRTSSLRENVEISFPPGTLYTTLTAL